MVCCASYPLHSCATNFYVAKRRRRFYFLQHHYMKFVAYKKVVIQTTNHLNLQRNIVAWQVARILLPLLLGLKVEKFEFDSHGNKRYEENILLGDIHLQESNLRASDFDALPSELFFSDYPRVTIIYRGWNLPSTLSSRIRTINRRPRLISLVWGMKEPTHCSRRVGDVILGVVVSHLFFSGFDANRNIYKNCYLFGTVNTCISPLRDSITKRCHLTSFNWGNRIIFHGVFLTPIHTVSK